ncbi:hypothetical protein VUN84_08255 [Micrococcaceae bacterium Sec5.8]
MATGPGLIMGSLSLASPVAGVGFEGGLQELVSLLFRRWELDGPIRDHEGRWQRLLYRPSKGPGLSAHSQT